MKINTYLTFNGNARQVIDFYQSIFGKSEVQIMPFSEMPPDPKYPIHEEAKNWIMHAVMKIGDDTVYLSDNFPGTPFNGTNGDIITVTVGDMKAEKAHEIYGKLKEGGQEIMPIAETFWSPAFGVLIDKFGVKWNIAAEN